ncbi:MAG: hypothetical protein IK064_01075, partial [Clostridia bacterium]|nr:hypothetical protein [Clostridia bacterium]
MKRFFALILTAAFALCALALVPGAAETQTKARIITADCTVKVGGKAVDPKILDGIESSTVDFENQTIFITAREPIGGVYIKFGTEPKKWYLTYNDGKRNCGTNGFLHEYQPIQEEGVTSIGIGFPTKATVADIVIVSKGDELPASIQVWKRAEGSCDLLIFACNGGDDQLYFAGAIPDAADRGAAVQVCYLVNHWDSRLRTHELLNALWESGADRYPVLGPCPYNYSTPNEEAALHLLEKAGFTFDGLVSYAAEQLRRFQPQVVLTHAAGGEHGNGAYMLTSHIVSDAVEAAGDASKYPASAAEYGAWDVPKFYVHLAEQNGIDFEIDTPLERFGGRTAFRVSQDALKCHATLADTAAYSWLLGENGSITAATQLSEYSPRQYGLVRSTVGEDAEKKDFYENTVLSGGEQPTEPPATEAPPTEEPIATEGPTEPATELPATQTPATAAPVTAEPAPTEPADT